MQLDQALEHTSSRTQLKEMNGLKERLHSMYNSKGFQILAHN